MRIVEVDVVALSFVVGTVIPIAVGIIAKARASSGLKAVINALLSAVSGYIVVAVKANGKIDLYSVLLGIGMTWVSSVGTYFGLLKPAGITTAVQSAVPGGIGTENRRAIVPRGRNLD